MVEHEEHAAPRVGPVEPPAVHCMSVNVRRRVPHLHADHPDRWERRRPVLRALLAVEQPTVLAVQEVLPDQAPFLQAALGPRWRPVLVGRDRDGGGEAVGVLYDAERMTLEGRERWSLSATPDVPGSRSWGAVFPRIAVGAHLLDQATGQRTLVIATHLDHLSAWSRRASARLLVRIVREHGGPAVVLGDHNTGAASAAHREITRDGVLVDTLDHATELFGAGLGTYPHYGRPRPGRRIDWILATPHWQVDVAGTNGFRLGGRAASDHEAVHAVLRHRPGGAGRPGSVGAATPESP